MEKFEECPSTENFAFSKTIIIKQMNWSRYYLEERGSEQ